MKSDQTLDTSGLACPLVLANAKQALDRMALGDVLKIISTDPSSVLDIKVFAETKHHELLKYMQEKDKFMFWLKKG